MCIQIKGGVRGKSQLNAAGSGTQWDPRLTAAFATSSLPQRIAGAVEGDSAKIA